MTIDEIHGQLTSWMERRVKEDASLFHPLSIIQCQILLLIAEKLDGIERSLREKETPSE